MIFYDENSEADEGHGMKSNTDSIGIELGADETLNTAFLAGK